MRKNSLIIVFFLFLLLGCTSEMDKRVETVLSISGSNRTELEAVLDHYKHEPQKLWLQSYYKKVKCGKI